MQLSEMIKMLLVVMAKRSEQGISAATGRGHTRGRRRAFATAARSLRDVALSVWKREGRTNYVAGKVRLTVCH